MKAWKIKLHVISEEFFQFSLVTYLILLLAETLKQGFVSSIFNLNILLIIVLISGVLMVVTNNVTNAMIKKHPERKGIKGTDIEYSVILAVGGALLVWFKTSELGKVSIMISVLAGLIIILLSVLIFSDKDENIESK